MVDIVDFPGIEARGTTISGTMSRIPTVYNPFKAGIRAELVEQMDEETTVFNLSNMTFLVPNATYAGLGDSGLLNFFGLQDGQPNDLVCVQNRCALRLVRTGAVTRPSQRASRAPVHVTPLSMPHARGSRADTRAATLTPACMCMECVSRHAQRLTPDVCCAASLCWRRARASGRQSSRCGAATRSSATASSPPSSSSPSAPSRTRWISSHASRSAPRPRLWPRSSGPLHRLGATRRPACAVILPLRRVPWEGEHHSLAGCKIFVNFYAVDGRRPACLYAF